MPPKVLIACALVLYALGFVLSNVNASNFIVWLVLPTILLVVGVIGLLMDRNKSD